MLHFAGAGMAEIESFVLPLFIKYQVPVLPKDTLILLCNYETHMKGTKIYKLVCLRKVQFLVSNNLDSTGLVGMTCS